MKTRKNEYIEINHIGISNFKTWHYVMLDCIILFTPTNASYLITYMNNKIKNEN